MNCFGNVYKVREDYKRLAYLIQSTAGDYLKKVHMRLYGNQKGFQLVWSLFDESFIRADPDYDIENIRKYFENDFLKVTPPEV